MAVNPRNRTAVRTLLALVVVVAGLFGGLAAASAFGSGQWTPRLGLDLEGGSQVILEPVVVGGREPNAQQIEQAVDIIRQRVDAQGVAEAEVTTLGGRNIVVSMPGQMSEATRQALEKSSQLSFRAVLAAASAAPLPTATATPTGTATGTATGSPTATGTGTPTPTSTARPSASATTSQARSAFPQGLGAGTPSPTGTATPAPATTADAAPTPTGSATGTATPSPTPTDGSDPAWITPALQQQFESFDCATDVAKIVDDPAKPLITCESDFSVKYILGPVEVFGRDISDATSGLRTLSTGQTTNQYEIQLQFNSKGAADFGKVTTRLVSLTGAQNQFAIVLDDVVISAPQVESAITAGTASITGNFTAESSKALADQLKFGALPLSFQIQTAEQISPTLGSDQLSKGIIAGIIGLVLVVVYSLFQYRALGLVTVASLLVASALTYVIICLLGWGYDFRLTMAGVTGIIVAIGVTADSFIIYFERVRDEVRDGRPLRAAVEAGWARARRTILISDAVNFLAAIVLWILAASNVRGFAFTLMVTTLIDVLVVFLFTHPVVHLIAGTKFFGGGHPLSGLDPERLGARTVRYAGRGRIAVGAPRPAVEGGRP